MEDARRFLRYVIPGLVLATVAGVLLFLILPSWVVTRVPRALAGSAGIGVVLAGLLASGGLGYILSTIHHSLLWSGNNGAPDYRSTIVDLVEAKALELRATAGALLSPAGLSRRDAWVIVTALWHERTQDSPSLTAGEVKVAALADLVHSTGTAWVASVFGSIIVFVLVASVGAFSTRAGDVVRYIAALFAAVSITWHMSRNYRRTALIAQQVIAQSLTDALVSAAEEKKAPISTRPTLEPVPPNKGLKLPARLAALARTVWPYGA